MARSYLCVSIDCECDKGAGWRSQRPLAFKGIAEGIGARLHPLFLRYGAKPTYLLSPEVMRDPASVEILAGLRGAELGAHLHGEYAEPGAFEPEVTQVFQRDYPREIEAEKLAYLTELFARAFGRKPTSFRAGRFGVGENSIGLLEELGYTVESSVTPHMDWSSKGARGLSFLDAPTQPYRPSAKDAGKRGSSRMLEVPVTIRRRLLGRLPLVGKRIEPRWLRPTRGSLVALLRVAKDEIAQATRAQPDVPVVLNAMFHNVEIIPDASPYAASESAAERILGRLEALLGFAAREGIAVIGLSEVPGIFAWR
jgi:hypothetical protein